MSRWIARFACPLLAILAAAHGAPAAEFTPESRVDEVTIYRQSALVSRRARLTLPPGSHRVVLKGLPTVADPDSVRVSGSGTAGIEIGGIEVQEEFSRPDLSPEQRQIGRELQDLDHQLALIGGRRTAIGTLREFLAGLKVTGGQEASKGVLTAGFAVESWQKAFDFFSSRLNALYEEERALDARQKDLDERAGVARGRLSQLASQAGIRHWSATVLVSAPHGGDVTLRVAYLAGQATWRPLYDARLDPAGDKVSLTWQGQIMQDTGEDWNDVAVTLATSRPSAGIDLPVLASLNLGILDRGAVSKMSFDSEYIDSLPILGKDYQDVLTLAPGVVDLDGDGNPDVQDRRQFEAPPPAPVQTAQAQAARREVAVSFVLPGRFDIPSDGQAHKHEIASRLMDARVVHRSVPLIAPAVFLVATMTLPEEIPLLPGKVQHFVGSDLVGCSMMAERAPGEEISLSFGPDDRLKAERRRLLKRVERRGKDDEIAYRFVTAIENHLGRDGVIEVKDRIPVSGDERVLISLDKDETTPGSVVDEKEPGVMIWNVSVPKGGKKEVALTYRVRSPRGIALTGLE